MYVSMCKSKWKWLCFQSVFVSFHRTWDCVNVSMHNHNWLFTKKYEEKNNPKFQEKLKCRSLNKDSSDFLKILRKNHFLLYFHPRFKWKLQKIPWNLHSQLSRRSKKMEVEWKWIDALLYVWILAWTERKLKTTLQKIPVNKYDNCFIIPHSSSSFPEHWVYN